MKLSALIHEIVPFPGGIEDMEITSITDDSRQVGSGTLFICIHGEKTDGHQYIPQALQRGAIAIICQTEWLNKHRHSLEPGVCWLGVDDTRLILPHVAAAFYNHPSRDMLMIGVTGTNGKTTTTHLLQEILSKSGIPTGILGTLYYKFGTYQTKACFTTPFPPELHQTLREMHDRGARAIVMESSSHALEQHRLDAIDYDMAIFTNITQDHLDYHQNMTEYLLAKQRLFSDLLKPTGHVILNADDPATTQLTQTSRGQVITYGLEQEADLRATGIKYQLAGVTFILNYRNHSLPVHLKLPGRFNVYNALAALAVAVIQDIPLPEAIQVIEAIPGVPGRMEVVSGEACPFTVLVDYSHTPDSLENVLRAARQFAQRRVIVVFGCGGDRDRTKRPKMGAIADAHADLLVVTSDNPRSEDPDTIIQDILTGIANDSHMIIQADRRKAIAQAIGSAMEGDVVIIAGKGHEDYQIFKDRTVHFDDREVAREILETLCLPLS